MAVGCIIQKIILANIFILAWGVESVSVDEPGGKIEHSGVHHEDYAQTSTVQEPVQIYFHRFSLDRICDVFVVFSRKVFFSPQVSHRSDIDRRFGGDFSCFFLRAEFLIFNC